MKIRLSRQPNGFVSVFVRSSSHREVEIYTNSRCGTGSACREAAARLRLAAERLDVLAKQPHPYSSDAHIVANGHFAQTKAVKEPVPEPEAPKPMGCHCDLFEMAGAQMPDACVLDQGAPQDCTYAKPGMDKHTCKFWKVITKESVEEAGGTWDPTKIQKTG